MAMFPSSEWVAALVEKLNSDAHYAQLARNWEGDLRFLIEPSGTLTETMRIYLDLWHGTCRSGFIEEADSTRSPLFVLRAPYDNFTRILRGELDPLQAMMTRKLAVQGSLPYMLRNVPTVLDFVRCAREVTDSIL